MKVYPGWEWNPKLTAYEAGSLTCTIESNGYLKISVTPISDYEV